MEVLERIELRGDETVLDAGCGPGRVTALLAERVPRGRVIGVDASESMIAKARETLGTRAELRVESLTELALEDEVDLVFSNAVFHWISDHDTLFARLRAALKPGGRLAAQCGGEGNVASLVEAVRTVAVRSPFAEHLANFEGVWNFSSVEDAERRLRNASFERIDCWLEHKAVTPEDPLDYVTSSALGPLIARLPSSHAAGFARAVTQELGSPLTLDYVRLNIEAHHPAR